MIPLKQFYQKQANTVIKNLAKRNMAGYYCETCEDALNMALSLMEPNSSVSWGGSQTIQDIGLLDALSDHPYTLIDRRKATNPEEVRETYLKAFNADYYLMSSNAITLDGELINIDGTGNRIAALIYGPKNVIVIAGMNKIVKDLESGIHRARNFAAPPNVLRVGQTEPPCTLTGVCHDCTNPQTICCQMVTTRYSRIPKRIQVILVGESLGF